MWGGRQMLALIIIPILIVISGIVFLIVYFDKKKYKNFVLNNSVALQQLNEINSRYNFNPHISYDQTYVYDNEIFYDNVSCCDYLIYQLQYIQKKVREEIKNVEDNKQKYSNYVDEIKSIEKTGEFQSPTSKLKLDRLIKTEKNIMSRKTLPAPVTQFTLTVTLYCSQINGRIYNEKSQTFSVDEIYALLKKLNNKNGKFFNDKDIWDAICRVERGKVSNKIRFAIYNRDGYRCRMCGASGRFNQLEIDHIIPIAKGGKTTYDNLQTLCHKCNVEKGDKIY